MAKLLSFKPSRNVAETSDFNRKRMLSQSSLPTHKFTPSKERKALRLMKTCKRDGSASISNLVRRKTGNEGQEKVEDHTPSEDAEKSGESEKFEKCADGNRIENEEKVAIKLVDYGGSSSDSSD